MSRHFMGGVIFAGLGGALAGVLAKIGDQSTWRWAADLGTYPSAWVFLLVTIGVAASSRRRAALYGGAFSVAAIGSYYAWSLVVLGFQVGLFPMIWMTVAIFVAPTFVAVIWMLDQRGGASAVVGAGVVAGIMLSEGPVRQFWNARTIGLPDGFPLHPVQAIVAVILSILTIGMLTQSWANRAAALALALPAGFAAAEVLDAVRSVVPI